MKKKILNFYARNGFEITKLVDRKPEGLTEVQVQAGATELYYKIMNGEEVKKLNIPRRVWQEAKKVEYKEFEKDQETLENSKEIISLLKRQLLFTNIGFYILCGAIVALLYLYGVM